MLKPKFITIEEFDNYWAVNLRDMLRTSANPSNQADLFLARVENRLMAYIDNNTFRRYKYEELQGIQLAAFKEAIILQAMYVYKNGDIGMDSGYDAERGSVIKRADLVEISVCQDAIDILSNAGLWNLAMKNKPRTWGCDYSLTGGGVLGNNISTASIDLENYLKKDGTDSMKGVLDLGLHRITSVADPIVNNDGANKQYVDNALDDYLKKDGSVAMTGDLDVNNNKINNVNTLSFDTTNSIQSFASNSIGFNIGVGGFGITFDNGKVFFQNGDDDYFAINVSDVYLDVCATCNFNGNDIINVQNIATSGDSLSVKSIDNSQTFTIDVWNGGKNEISDIKLSKTKGNTLKQLILELANDNVSLDIQTTDSNRNTYYADVVDVADDGSVDFINGAKSSIEPTNNVDLVNKKYVDSAVAKIGQFKYIVSNSASNTPLNVVWYNGSTKITGTLVASADTEFTIYLVPCKHSAEEAQKGYDEYLAIKNLVYSWEILGNTDIDLSNYLKKDGSVAMTGNLNLNSNNITNVGTISGTKFVNFGSSVQFSAAASLAANSIIEDSAENNAKNIVNQGYVTNNFVPKTRTINGQALSSDITIDSVTTAANLTNAGSFSGTKAITFTVGGKTSSEFTVPYATKAGSADNATTAASATKATQDGDGNVISSTYLKKEDTVLLYGKRYFLYATKASSGSTDPKVVLNMSFIKDDVTTGTVDSTQINSIIYGITKSNSVFYPATGIIFYTSTNYLNIIGVRSTGSAIVIRGIYVSSGETQDVTLSLSSTSLQLSGTCTAVALN